MVCKGEFVFRGIEKRDGGEFTNDKGELIKYQDAYVLKVDEDTTNGIFERKLKVNKDNSVLLNKIKNIKLYDRICLICDVQFYGSGARVIPVDIDSNNK